MVYSKLDDWAWLVHTTNLSDDYQCRGEQDGGASADSTQFQSVHKPLTCVATTLTLPRNMKTPVFKRRSMAFDLGNYYAANTDVWVFGSPAQYSDFASFLTTHKGPKRIPADERGGMDILILPIASHVTREFLVIHERLVHQDGRFNMELIFGGSRVGFGLLAKSFRLSVRDHSGDPDRHYHIDDGEEALVLPSVFLNIRGPIEDIDERLPELAPPASTDLLPDMTWRDPAHWSYEPLEDYGSMFGRIPIATLTP